MPSKGPFDSHSFCLCRRPQNCDLFLICCTQTAVPRLSKTIWTSLMIVDCSIPHYTISSSVYIITSIFNADSGVQISSATLICYQTVTSGSSVTIPNLVKLFPLWSTDSLFVFQALSVLLIYSFLFSSFKVSMYSLPAWKRSTPILLSHF